MKENVRFGEGLRAGARGERGEPTGRLFTGELSERADEFKVAVDRMAAGPNVDACIVEPRGAFAGIGQADDSAAALAAKPGNESAPEKTLEIEHEVSVNTASELSRP